MGIAGSANVKVARFRQACLLSPSWVGRASSARSFKSLGRCALVLWALLGVPAACLGSKTLCTPQRPTTSALSIQGGWVAAPNGDGRLDIIIVEPQGWGPKGFRYRIVLDSTSPCAASSLDLTAEEGGLRVMARDVDGIGDDVDLIIKSARSLTPVGVWLNNHHGGFAKADSSVYAPSIWSEGPLVLSDNPPDILQTAFLPSHQSCIYLLIPRCPFERVAGQRLVKTANFAVPSRLTADPHKTRGPPSPLPVN
jgi:hypothetical protein